MTAIPTLTPAELARFRSKIQMGDGCHVWARAVNNKGYGRFEIYRGCKRVRILAHRLAYQLATGIDPGPLKARHSCDNPPCCNPAHLSLGTQAQNIRDAVERGRNNTSGLAEQRARYTAAARATRAAGKKKCHRCKVVKDLASFCLARRNWDGLAYQCRACVAEVQRMARSERAALQRDEAGAA